MPPNFDVDSEMIEYAANSLKHLYDNVTNKARLSMRCGLHDDGGFREREDTRYSAVAQPAAANWC